MIIHPTVVLENDSLMEYSFLEFYSPVFRIFPYSANAEILSFYRLPFQKDLRMGSSVFGDHKLAEQLRELKIVTAYNLTFFQQENGNRPFGGYGVRASHVMRNGKINPKPILVSKEITDLVKFGNW